MQESSGLDFEPYKESEGLWRAVEWYRERYGCYLERILVDKIYRNRQTLAFCKEHRIRLSGPALGSLARDWAISSSVGIVLVMAPSWNFS